MRDAKTEIGAPIIKRFSVYVIYVKMWRGIHYEPVKQRHLTRNIGISSSVPSYAPASFICALKISVIQKRETTTS